MYHMMRLHETELTACSVPLPLSNLATSAALPLLMWLVPAVTGCPLAKPPPPPLVDEQCSCPAISQLPTPTCNCTATYCHASGEHGERARMWLLEHRSVRTSHRGACRLCSAMHGGNRSEHLARAADLSRSDDGWGCWPWRRAKQRCEGGPGLVLRRRGTAGGILLLQVL